MELKIAAIVAIVMLTIGGITGLVLSPDNAERILTITGAAVGLLALFLKANQIGEDTKATKEVAVGTALAVDGRLSQLLELVQASAKAQGILQGETGVFQELPPTKLPEKATVQVVLPLPDLPTPLVPDETPPSGKDTP